MLKERFSGVPVAAFYASDLRRAAETAAIIAAPHHRPVSLVPALREVNFGCWEGLTYDQVCSAYPQAFREWLFHPEETRIPGGESFAEVKARAWAAVRDIVTRHPGETVLAVSHGGTIRAILSAALVTGAQSIWRLAQDPAAVNVIDFYSEFSPVVVLVNDTSHLVGDKEVPG